MDPRATQPLAVHEPSTKAVPPPVILTPDQRLRVFVSSTLQELAEERKAAKAAVQELRLSPVMFELGARSHPPRALYRSYLEQSHIFVGIYWQRYGWVAPGEEISGLEDEYRLSGKRPKLIYVKTPAPEREDRLKVLLKQVQSDDEVSYKPFSSAEELKELLENDLAVLLTERFAASLVPPEREEAGAGEEKPRRSRWPLPATPLIGRQKELAEVTKLLQDKDVRLVTLLGPGGVGKSRLALEVAGYARGSFRDGVHFVPLGAVNDPSLVVPAIAGTLGVRESGGLSLVESLKEHLQDKELLLLLDNFEQVVIAAPVLSELLASAPALKLMVTSRSALRLSAEHVYVVPPLTLPGGKRSPLEAIRNTEAVRLFVERAQAVKPAFTLGVDNALAVAEICYRLDGLPLAIELAAARVQLLTPQALLKRLDKRFDLLKTGARDLPTRQQTLRNTIDWSYGLLGDEDKRLFDRLAVFAGGCSFEAAEAVCGEAKADSLEGLASLVEKSLLQGGEKDGEPRFTMLESIHEYARERLEARGEREAIRQRHAAFFLELAEEASRELKGGDQALWLNRLELEHDNLRAALRWTLTDDLDLALRLSGGLVRFWLMHSHLVEGRRWLGELLPRLENAPPSNLYAFVANGAGVLAWSQGDYDEAQALLEKSRGVYQTLGNKKGVADELSNIGGLTLERGDYAGARELLEQALTLRRELGDTPGIATSLVNLGLVALHDGDFDAACQLFEEALVHHRALGDNWSMALALTNLGVTVLRLGDTGRAKTHLRESLELAGALGDKETMNHILIGVAALAGTLKEDDRAAQLWGAAEALREAIGYVTPPSSTFEEERVLKEAVEARLGTPAYADAWAKGRALGLEGATALALKRA